MAWSYTNRVSEERQAVLLGAPDFDVILNRILAEMKITAFDFVRGNCPELKGCTRPEFSLVVSSETFDLFYNSPQGYRGQYHESPEIGQRANAALISRVSDRLLEHAGAKATKNRMDADGIRKSLRAGSAKIWINEKGARAQRGDDIQNLVVELELEPWVSTARAYVSDPGRYPDPNKELKAVDGVTAPTGSILEIKGAFIDQDRQEHVADDKKDRSRQIHLYGFT